MSSAEGTGEWRLFEQAARDTRKRDKRYWFHVSYPLTCTDCNPCGL